MTAAPCNVRHVKKPGKWQARLDVNTIDFFSAAARSSACRGKAVALMKDIREAAQQEEQSFNTSCAPTNVSRAVFLAGERLSNIGKLTRSNIIKAGCDTSPKRVSTANVVSKLVERSDDQSSQSMHASRRVMKAYGCQCHMTEAGFSCMLELAFASGTK